VTAKNNKSPIKIILLISFSLVVILGIFFTVGKKMSRKNLLLITLDTVRADRLRCYGYKDISTPNMDFLAANGVLFENAISPAPLTLPAHTTVLTGLYPTVHGIRDNTTYMLSDKAITLAEILSDNGYKTAAVIGAFVLDSSYGLDQGFQYYDDKLPSPVTNYSKVLAPGERSRIQMKEISERPASTVTRSAISWLRENSGENFFLWVHYYDPHFPYNPPPPFTTKYLDNPYDGEIAFVDKNIGSLFNELRKKGIFDRTLIVLAGDHGEGLGEHEEPTHSIFIYDTTIRVPLIMGYPGRIPAGIRINPVVSLVDVVPTVLDLLEIESTAEFNGKNLLELVEGSSDEERFIYSESMFPYLNYGWSKVMSLRGSRWKYIKAPRPELYDMVSDPSELNNLVHSEKETAERLEATLSSIITETNSLDTNLAESASLSTQDRERLLALGYLAGAPPVEDEASLEDPKDMIQYHALINYGEKAMDEGRLDEALESFKKVATGNPANALVRNLMGMVYYQYNDTVNARIEFKKAIELNYKLADAHHNLGNIHFQQENYPEAASCYENALELDPGAGEYYVALAQIYSRMNETKKAENAYKKAIEMGFSSPQLYLANAITLRKIGKYEGSRQSFEQALKADPSYVEAYDEYGTLLEEMTNYAGAITKYKQALSINPDFVASRYNLARLLIKTGKEDEAIKNLRTVVTSEPLHSKAHYLLGELYYRKGSNRQAKENFLKFLELETSNVAVRKQVEARLAELK
jgi:arylsulfatase A-like enzyme/Tfp pilus assembly protein PilF